jgi:hypothetical protein
MRVQFHRSGRGDAYVVLVQREDGQTVRLPGHAQTAVPHHLAHFVTEHGFRLDHGVFGCIAAGAMFTGMSIVDGRGRYDAQVRSRAVLRSFGAELGLAESLTGVVHEAVEQGLDTGTAHRRLREAWGALRAGPCPFPPEDLRRVMGLLGRLGARWRGLGPGQVLALRWDDPGWTPPRNAGPPVRAGGPAPSGAGPRK